MTMSTGAPTVIVATPEQLEQLITAAVTKVLAEAANDPGPALLDRSGIARVLGVGTSTVDRFRKAGCPVVWIGDSPRFLADECIAWLREHRREPPDAPEPNG